VTVTKSDAEGTQSETVADTTKPPKNQSEIDSWFDVNDKALGNIMLQVMIFAVFQHFFA